MMKAKNVIFLFVLLIVLSSCARTKLIKGNKNLITKEIQISDFNGIEFTGSIRLEYEQKENEAPYFQITVDENIFPYLEITVKDKTLIVSPEKGVPISPTTCTIKTNSKDLIKAAFAGSGSMDIHNPLACKNLDISTSGSGRINITEVKCSERLRISTAGSGKINLSTVQAKDLDIRSAGSGNVILENVTAENMKLVTAGSGSSVVGNILSDNMNVVLSGSRKMMLSGRVKMAEMSLTGSGSIEAFDCLIDDVYCTVSGSGKADIHALKRMNASVSGSGTIYYKGNPQEIQKNGTGRAEQVIKKQE